MGVTKYDIASIYRDHRQNRPAYRPVARGHKRTSQGGGGGGGSPPEKFFSGKTAKIYVISKRFSGKMFGQTGFLPPKSGNFLGKKKIFFGQTGAAPQVRSCLYAYARGGCEGCAGTPHRQLRSTFLLKNK